MYSSRNSYENEPLPPGWIKRYDQASQAFYFLDTNSSSPRPVWTDPRSQTYTRDYPSQSNFSPPPLPPRSYNLDTSPPYEARGYPQQQQQQQQNGPVPLEIPFIARLAASSIIPGAGIALKIGTRIYNSSRGAVEPGQQQQQQSYPSQGGYGYAGGGGGNGFGGGGGGGGSSRDERKARKEWEKQMEKDQKRRRR